MTGVTRSREWEGLDRSLAFRVDGERGWFLFRGYVERPDGVAWVDGYGPVGPRGQFPVVRPVPGAAVVFGDHRFTSSLMLGIANPGIAERVEQAEEVA